MPHNHSLALLNGIYLNLLGKMFNFPNTLSNIITTGIKSKEFSGKHSLRKIKFISSISTRCCPFKHLHKILGVIQLVLA